MRGSGSVLTALPIANFFSPVRSLNAPPPPPPPRALLPIFVTDSQSSILMVGFGFVWGWSERIDDFQAWWVGLVGEP